MGIASAALTVALLTLCSCGHRGSKQSCIWMSSLDHSGSEYFCASDDGTKVFVEVFRDDAISHAWIASGDPQDRCYVFTGYPTKQAAMACLDRIYSTVHKEEMGSDAKPMFFETWRGVKAPGMGN